MPPRPALVAAALIAAAWPAAGEVEGAEVALGFARHGEVVAKLSLVSLRETCGDRRVEVDDPYYGRRKSFHAVPLRCALERGFGVPVAELAAESFLLQAVDGYAKPADGARLGEPGGFLAFADAERTPSGDLPFRWEPIDRRQVDPAPFYLVWIEAGQQDIHRYPWPYQLARIEIVDFASRYPHALPRGAPDGSPARAGFALFRRDCFSCHAVNGQGGKIGPDLNVPMSIVEYRPAEQIRAFIRNPQRFRYTSMPANPQLGEAELDQLLAYFEWMRAHKRDPQASEGGPPPG